MTQKELKELVMSITTKEELEKYGEELKDLVFDKEIFLHVVSLLPKHPDGKIVELYRFDE